MLSCGGSGMLSQPFKEMGPVRELPLYHEDSGMQIPA